MWAQVKDEGGAVELYTATKVGFPERGVSSGSNRGLSIVRECITSRSAPVGSAQGTVVTASLWMCTCSTIQDSVSI